MTREEFVRRLKLVAYDRAVEDTLANVEAPPGRRPAQSLLALSAWYRGLSSHDQERVKQVAQLAARSAVFSFLTVIDGVRSLREADEEQCVIELSSVTQGRRTVLHGDGGPELHDEFAALVPID